MQTFELRNYILSKLSFNIWPNCPQVQRKVSLQNVFQTCLKALRVTTYWSVAKGLKPVGNPTWMDFLNLGRAQTKVEIQDPQTSQPTWQKANNSISFRKHPRNRLGRASWKTLDAITDCIWIALAKPYFLDLTAEISCPVDWASKRWDRAKGFDQQAIEQFTSHCMSFHPESTKFIVEQDLNKKLWHKSFEQSPIN